MLTINGVDRTLDLLSDSLRVEDVLNDRQSTCTLDLMNREGLGWPSNEQEIIITDSLGNRVFGGIIVKVTFLPKGSTGYGIPAATIECQDYVRLMDKNLVNQVYVGMTDQAIIDDIITSFCAGSGITTTNVGVSATISQIKFNYVQPSQAFRKITDNTGYNWYIDYFKNLYYFPNSQIAAPFDINTANDDKVFDLSLVLDNSQLRNRVYVRGSTRVSDSFTYLSAGDGHKTQFVLPNSPSNTSVTVKVNGTTKTLGIVNTNTSGFDWYLDQTNGYVQQDSGGTVLATTDILEVDYVYDVPIIVVVEDSTSIATYGAHEFMIQDKNIKTSQAAIDRGQAELLDYSASLNEGTFSTYTAGLRSGQIIHITDADYGFSSQAYVVQKVVCTSIGNGNFKYDVTLASAKTMGIIRFLIEMLETQQNLVDIADNEVIDNLKTLTDTISESDSISNFTDTPSKNWATGSGDTTDANWDLFQWA